MKRESVWEVLTLVLALLIEAASPVAAQGTVRSQHILDAMNRMPLELRRTVYGGSFGGELPLWTSADGVGYVLAADGLVYVVLADSRAFRVGPDGILRELDEKGVLREPKQSSKLPLQKLMDMSDEELKKMPVAQKEALAHEVETQIMAGEGVANIPKVSEAEKPMLEFDENGQVLRGGEGQRIRTPAAEETVAEIARGKEASPIAAAPALRASSVEEYGQQQERRRNLGMPKTAVGGSGENDSSHGNAGYPQVGPLHALGAIPGLFLAILLASPAALLRYAILRRRVGWGWALCGGLTVLVGGLGLLHAIDMVESGRMMVSLAGTLTILILGRWGSPLER